jgi:hypothetical protein
MYYLLKSLFIYIIFNIIGINNTIYIYVNLKYYYLYLKERLIFPIFNLIKNVNKKDIIKTQQLIDIKVIQNNNNTRNEYSILKYIPHNNNITLLDLHYAITNIKNIGVGDFREAKTKQSFAPLKKIESISSNYNINNNTNIEIIYKINNYKYIYIFPIYINDITTLNNNNILSLDNNNIQIFPIHNENELLHFRNDIDYVYANFTISKKNNELNMYKELKNDMKIKEEENSISIKNNNIKKYDCSDILKMYSGPYCDFYSNKYVTTLTNDLKIAKIPYKLSIDMINLSYSNLFIENSTFIDNKINISDELIITEIEALRDDNQDFIASLEKKILGVGDLN